jgi:hypothetical protein
MQLFKQYFAATGGEVGKEDDDDDDDDDGLIGVKRMVCRKTSSFCSLPCIRRLDVCPALPLGPSYCHQPRLEARSLGLT